MHIGQRDCLPPLPPHTVVLLFRAPQLLPPQESSIQALAMNVHLAKLTIIHCIVNFKIITIFQDNYDIIHRKAIQSPDEAQYYEMCRLWLYNSAMVKQLILHILHTSVTFLCIPKEFG